MQSTDESFDFLAAGVDRPEQVPYPGGPSKQTLRGVAPPRLAGTGVPYEPKGAWLDEDDFSAQNVRHWSICEMKPSAAWVSRQSFCTAIQ